LASTPSPSSKIVLSCRLTYSALGGGDPMSGVDGYLARARALTSRAEALGATLAAWSATTLAFAWDVDAVEEAIEFAVSLRDEAPAPERSWTCGIAEGPMEPLAAGGRGELAWGAPLVLAVALARVARPGEVLLDADVSALRDGALATLGARVSTDAGRRVRGWRLDTEHAWRRPPSEAPPGPVRDAVPPEDEVTLQRQTITPEFAATLLAKQDAEQAARDATTGPIDMTTGPLDPPTTPVSFTPISSPAPSSDRTLVVAPPSTPPESSNGRTPLAAKIREIASGPDGAEALRSLRAERAKLESAPPAARCQVSLALGVALALGGRPEDALLEALDALARAREDGDPKGLEACLAFLAKLYAGIGRAEEAGKLLAKRPAGA
jgi:hypothetical protein